MVYPLNKPLCWETTCRSNTESKLYLIYTYKKKAVLTKHLYVKSIHKKNIEFKFCDL